MRRTELKRHTPLARGESRLRRKRWGIKPRRPRRNIPRDPEIIAAWEQLAKLGGNAQFKTRPNADPAFVAWSHTQDCTFARYIPGHVCSGSRIVFAHEGEGSGMGLKAPDQVGFAACETGHAEYGELRGEFRHWKKADRQAFEAEVSDSEYARFLAHGSRRSAA